MLGGAFDRHPNMKVMLTEVRADWLPATLRHLDAIYEKHRADLPAKRKPSEYWQDNCMAGVSFMHKAEVEMRYEIGIDKFGFRTGLPAYRGYLAKHQRLLEAHLCWRSGGGHPSHAR